MTKSTGTISKTKALAMRRKPKAAVVAFRAKKSSGSDNKNSTPRQILLASLMEQHLLLMPTLESDEDSNTKSTGAPASGLSFEGILGSLGMNNRNTKWRNEWKNLEAEGCIEKVDEMDGPTFTSGFKLTGKGMEEATTEEVKEAMAAAAAATTTAKNRTNEDLHKHIKGQLMNKRGDQIFDLLLEHEAGLTRKELAQKLNIAATGAYFSYALQQLKDLGYAKNAKLGGNKMTVCLTSKAFVGGAKDAWYGKKEAKKNQQQKQQNETTHKKEGDDDDSKEGGQN